MLDAISMQEVMVFLVWAFVAGMGVNLDRLNREVKRLREQVDELQRPARPAPSRPYLQGPEGRIVYPGHDR